MYFNFSGCCRSVLSKIKKHGFTLAEALIITVMTGYCLLPILGTMQNAQTRAQNFDHLSKMQLYTRSRLTNEIANAAFDHTAINTEDEYHYIVYVDRGTETVNGQEEKATLEELPKTSVPPEDLRTLLNEDKSTWNRDAKILLGLPVAENADSREPNWGMPYLNIIHVYKTTVETKNKPSISDSNNALINEDNIPKALLGIVVKTSLLESNGDEYYPDDGRLILTKTPVEGSTGEYTYTFDENQRVSPVSLFAFVNLPAVSDEAIWLADAANCCVYGIDPITKSVSSTIQLPKKENGNLNGKPKEEYKPYHLAIHPNLKLLACSSKKFLYLINIDKNSENFGKYIVGHTYTGTEVEENGGIVFRPDGKYLFVCPEQNKGGPGVNSSRKINSFKVDCKILSDKIVWNSGEKPNLTLANPNGTLIDREVVDVIASNDGYLYVARKDKEYGVIRFPMYCSEAETSNTWKGELFATEKNGIDGDIKSMAISPDYTYLAIVTIKTPAPPTPAGSEEYYLYIYDTRDGKQLLSKDIKTMPDVTDFKPQRVVFSVFTSNTQPSFFEEKSYSLTITNEKEEKQAVAYAFYIENSSPKDLKILRKINYSKSKGANIAVNTPDNNTVLISDKKKPQLYLEDAKATMGDQDLTESEPAATVKPFSTSKEDPKNCTDIVASERDVLAVASNTKIKQYDLNTLKEIDDSELTDGKNITTLAMNPQGDLLISGYGSSSQGYSLHFLRECFTVSKGDYKRIKACFDDRNPNMAFFLEAPRGTDPDELDAFRNENSDSDWVGADQSYKRKDFKLDSDWERLDLIGMPRGGAMALYGKSDGSSMLEWIGRRNWDQDGKKGNYKLFARWTNMYIAPDSEYYLPTSTLPNKTTIAGSAGGITRLSKAVPANTVVNSFSCKTGNHSNWSDSTEIRYITPVLLEKQTDGGFKIVNYGINSLAVSKNNPYNDKPIIWK